MPHQYLVLTRAVPGREAEFQTWYEDQHLPDLQKVPGVVGARLHKIDRVVHRDGDLSWTLMVIYQIEGDPAEVLAEIKRRAGTDLMPMTDALMTSETLQILAQ